MIADCSPTLTPKRSPSVSTNDDTAASGNEDGSRRASINTTRENVNNSSEVPLLPDGSIDFDGTKNLHFCPVLFVCFETFYSNM